MGREREVTEHWVDLTKESLSLQICSTCKALHRVEDEQDHGDWHVRTGTA